MKNKFEKKCNNVKEGKKKEDFMRNRETGSREREREKERTRVIYGDTVKTLRELYAVFAKIKASSYNFRESRH